MISLNNINLGTLNLGGMNTSEIKLGYPSSGCPVPGLKGLQGFYMGKGLTNEMMSRDPIWRDKSGKGNHIALKNFGWKLDSGCGKYAYDFKSVDFTCSGPSYGSTKYSDKFIIDKADPSRVNVAYNSPSFKCTIRVLGLTEAVTRGEVVELRIYNSVSIVSSRVKLKSNGIYNIDITGSTGSIYMFVVSKTGTIANPVVLQSPITIEQIPDYDGAICFDGVDDFGETIKDLNFTDNYSVVSLVVPFYNNRNNVIFGKNHLKDVYCNYAKGLSFYSAGKAAVIADETFSNHAKLLVCRRNESVQEIKDVFSNYSNSIISIPIIDNPGKYYLGRTPTVPAYGQFAMFAHAIFDHYISDEELEILSDYWKKEFPELFPDQAWTVTGKTNFDADRATIKNITGNGNDLVLTNVGYAENSGYGKWPIRIATASTIFRDQPYGTAHFIADGSTYSTLVAGNLNSVHFKFRVREMQEGAVFVVRSVRSDNYNAAYKDFRVKENGIYEFEYENTDEPFAIFFYNGTLGSGVYWDFYVDILQDPDYEGYLVTDGVDDQIKSSNFILPEKYTIVGDWKLINNADNYSGIAKPNQFYIYNLSNGIRIFVNSYNSMFDVLSKSIKAVCSDGRCYDSDWNEISFVPGNITNSGGALYIGYLSNHFTQIAFKNLAIYDNAFLTKDQCIRAYNYLQTIKNN